MANGCDTWRPSSSSKSSKATSFRRHILRRVIDVEESTSFRRHILRRVIDVEESTSFRRHVLRRVIDVEESTSFRRHILRRVIDVEESTSFRRHILRRVIDVEESTSFRRHVLRRAIVSPEFLVYFLHRLKIYCGEEIGVFIRNHSTQHSSFFKIDTSRTVKEALEGKEIIEYPTFHVVLSRHFSEYPTDISSPIGKRRRLDTQNINSDNPIDEGSVLCPEDAEDVKECI
ncbi:Hypothetical predicted protein [Paramuricea clavata]|uniref:BCD1 alpha/beta domain-containing protein n=1 Tax=Paramuricea clavata TaxID=317549 RepID=A0A7D9HEH9_PARCT|nr:Hypothetical predicted protein [Paramuricea clavata]